MKEYLGILAIILTLIGYAPFLHRIFKGKVNPHPFTWFIWTFATLIVFFAQILNGGGAGAWSMGFTGSITFVITVFALYKKSDYKISGFDWLFLFFSFLALPMWFFTSNAFYAVLILTIVDLFGYMPTFKKAYYRPFDEYLPIYFMMSLRNVVSIMAMNEYSWTNIFFQITVTIANFVAVGITVSRRKILNQR